MLDAVSLLLRAQAETGLADWGDESLPERFGLAVDLLNAQGLDAAGEQAAAGVCHWLLTSRLQVFEDFRRYPIAEEKIERPVFATGEGRAGTTFLHALLSVDPGGRALRFWEQFYPSPPPGLAGPDDMRRARADDDWREINARLPGWLPMHPYNDMLGHGIPECERTWAYDFRGLTPTAWWRVPMEMQVGKLPLDGKAQYRLHKMMLQQCQFGREKKYWVLKGFHQARMRELFAAYPDACVIWTHRDPVQVIASTVMLSGNLEPDARGPCRLGRNRTADPRRDRRGAGCPRLPIRRSTIRASTTCAMPIWSPIRWARCARSTPNTACPSTRRPKRRCASTWRRTRPTGMASSAIRPMC